MVALPSGSHDGPWQPDWTSARSPAKKPSLMGDLTGNRSASHHLQPSNSRRNPELMMGLVCSCMVTLKGMIASSIGVMVFAVRAATEVDTEVPMLKNDADAVWFIAMANPERASSPQIVGRF